MKIAIGNFEKISDNKWHPLHVQYDYENYLLPNYDDIVFVEAVEPENIEGKYSIMYYNPQTNSIFYEYFDIPSTPEEELRQRIDLIQQALDDLLLGGMQ